MTETIQQTEVLEGEVVGPGRGGHNTKLNDLHVSKLVKHLEEGMPMSVAAPLADLHPRTPAQWMRKAEEGEYAEGSEEERLVLKILKAKATFNAKTIKEWLALAKETKQWAGLATFLERTDPDNFKRPSEKKSANENVLGVLEVRLHEIERKGKPELGYTGS